MLKQETTIGIYIDEKLDDVLIEPDGNDYHLFLTGQSSGNNDFHQEKAKPLGSIFFVNKGWVYEGGHLDYNAQQQIADYIINYIGDDDTPIFQTGGVTGNF